MQKTTASWTVSLSICAALFIAGPGMAETKSATEKEHTHTHDHAHGHSHGEDKEIYKGYFKDSQVSERPLSDWAGKWQSVYPYLQDGTLDPVFAHKAEHGDKSAKQYRDYYEVGYRSDVSRIDIEGDKISFHKKDGTVSARYASDGYEILTYEKGNRGVRFVFKKVEGDKAAPGFIQFSDHRIAPAKADHYHLYLGDDRAALLKEVTNWPTYYGASLSGKDIAHEMMHH
ncbi:ZinT family metal-binding protein [Brucellaceae bacterium D45D]